MCFHILYCIGPTNCPERTSVSTSAGGTKQTFDLLGQDGEDWMMNGSIQPDHSEDCGDGL